MWNFFSKDRIKLIFTTFSIPVLGQKCGKRGKNQFYAGF
jgi:hypothetical protein